MSSCACLRLSIGVPIYFSLGPSKKDYHDCVQRHVVVCVFHIDQELVVVVDSLDMAR